MDALEISVVIVLLYVSRLMTSLSEYKKIIIMHHIMFVVPYSSSFVLQTFMGILQCSYKFRSTKV